MHYYQHHIGDYLADTTHLTLLEHGAYLRLMMLYYQTECALDANALRMVCARTAEEIHAAETVLREFFTQTEYGWIHKRCDAEISRFRGRSESAKASARARWSERNANALLTQCEGNANHKPITNNQETPIDAAQPTKTPSASSKKGKRLPDDWMLPKAWGEWALSERKDWNSEEVRRCAERFADFWHAKPGREACKLDWLATWRNWVRNDRGAAQASSASPRSSLFAGVI